MEPLLHSRHPLLSATGDFGEEVGLDVGAALLPGRAGEYRRDAFSRRCAWEITRSTSPRPLAGSERRSANQNPPSSLVKGGGELYRCGVAVQDSHLSATC